MFNSDNFFRFSGNISCGVQENVQGAVRQFVSSSVRLLSSSAEFSCAVLLLSSPAHLLSWTWSAQLVSWVRLLSSMFLVCSVYSPALFLDLLSSSSEFNEGVLSRILTLLKSSNFLTPLWQTVPIMNPISLLVLVCIYRTIQNSSNQLFLNVFNKIDSQSAINGRMNWIE